MHRVGTPVPAQLFRLVVGSCFFPHRDVRHRTWTWCERIRGCRVIPNNVGPPMLNVREFGCPHALPPADGLCPLLKPLFAAVWRSGLCVPGTSGGTWCALGSGDSVFCYFGTGSLIRSGTVGLWRCTVFCPGRQTASCNKRRTGRNCGANT